MYPRSLKSAQKTRPLTPELKPKFKIRPTSPDTIISDSGMPRK